MYEIAPIKRMSILERRRGDDRAFFLRHWHDIHGAMVSHLPHLFAYVQNHIVEGFPCDHPGFPGDGIVEQLWQSTALMQRGYNSPVVRDLIADEVNYLGHGSNYAILAQGPLRLAPSGSKLLAALSHGGAVDLADKVAEAAAVLCDDLVRDDVIATIAKPNFLPAPPRPVDMFLHLYCADQQMASEVGGELAKSIAALPFGAGAAVEVWRVATAPIVSPKQNPPD
jgi:uncharacterized protein (TIGR02118 family)